MVKHNKKPSLGDFFKLPNPGLRAYLHRVRDGNPEDYRPPLFKGRTRNSVIKAWQKILDNQSVIHKYPSLIQFEYDMRDKIGPMSIQLPLNERWETISDYFILPKHSGKDISPKGIALASKFFSRASGIRLKSESNTLADMKLSTNSGSPFFMRRRRVAKETLNAKFFSDAQRGIYYQDQYKLCAVLGWRGQEGGSEDDDVKQRVVWMFPMKANMQELRVYQPCISAMQKHGLIPAYVSNDAVDAEVTRLFDTKGKDDVVVCTDFTKFDQHFNVHLQSAAFSILKSLLVRCPESTDWLTSVYPMKYNIPLCVSESQILFGPHGMGSGSGGTNFDECLTHKALQFEAADDDGQVLNLHSMAYGDDGVLTWPGCSAEKVTASYTKHGLEMNPSKQYESKHDCVVLRRWHGDSYRVKGIMVGVYSTFRALGRLLAQERYYDPDKWSKEMVILRSLSILENCKWHPCFKEFVKFVISGDKYGLGLYLPGFFENLVNLAKKAMENFDGFLGYNRSIQEEFKPKGILDWDVVKYLLWLKDHPKAIDNRWCNSDIAHKHVEDPDYSYANFQPSTRVYIAKHRPNRVGRWIKK